MLDKSQERREGEGIYPTLKIPTKIVCPFLPVRSKNRHGNLRIYLTKAMGFFVARQRIKILGIFFFSLSLFHFPRENIEKRMGKLNIHARYGNLVTPLE